MRKIIIIVLIISIFSKCFTTRPEVMEQPKDYSEVIEEVEESKELETKPELKKKVVQAIKEQTKYSNDCYTRLQEFDERLTKLEKENESLRKENLELKQDLYKYQMREFIFWVGIGCIILFLIGRALWPIIWPLIKRAMGIPPII